jgi:integrase
VSVANRLRERIARVGREIGLQRRVTPQVLRKSVGDVVWDHKGGDARLVAQALGDTIETVQKHYIDHPRPGKLAEAFRGIEEEER